jgi:NADH dehydrogenase
VGWAKDNSLGEDVDPAMEAETHAVTGAFGYTGSRIAKLLLQQGHRVINLTGSPDRSSKLSSSIESFPFSFSRPDKLTESLTGVSVLYNT